MNQDTKHFFHSYGINNKLKNKIAVIGSHIVSLQQFINFLIKKIEPKMLKKNKPRSIHG